MTTKNPANSSNSTSHSTAAQVATILKKNEEHLLREWVENLSKNRSSATKISANEQQGQCREFLRTYVDILQSADSHKGQLAAWQPLKDFLVTISRSRTLQGFSPGEVANFVFSLKQPLFNTLQKSSDGNVDILLEGIMQTGEFLDSLGVYTMEVYQKAREEIIVRQQEEMLELSTPVVKLWDGILALPMIGTLDSGRTQVVMETLLQKIVETNSEVAIIDITGVPTVDTLVAQHLIKTVTAARLMGAECIISGIRPQIAATIVHLGVDLGNIVTKANLADAFAAALRKNGRTVGRAVHSPASHPAHARPESHFNSFSKEVRA